MASIDKFNDQKDDSTKNRAIARMDEYQKIIYKRLESRNRVLLIRCEQLEDKLEKQTKEIEQLLIYLNEQNTIKNTQDLYLTGITKQYTQILQFNIKLKYILYFKTIFIAIMLVYVFC